MLFGGSEIVLTIFLFIINSRTYWSPNPELESLEGCSLPLELDLEHEACSMEFVCLVLKVREIFDILMNDVSFLYTWLLLVDMKLLFEGLYLKAIELNLDAVTVFFATYSGFSY